MQQTSRYIQLATLSGLLVVGLGCTSPEAQRRWEDQLTQADSLADQERYEEATEAYLALRDGTREERDERYIAYRLAFVEERRGNWEAAIEGYMVLLDDWEVNRAEDEYTPRALFRTGLILYDQLDRQEEALTIWRNVVHHFPDVDGPAHRSLDLLLVHYEQNALYEEAIQYFATEYPALRNTRMGDNMVYWMAYFYRHYLNDTDRALELFVDFRREFFERSGLLDQAEIEIMAILEEREEWETLLQLMHDIVAEREFDIVFGSFASPNQELCAYRIPQIYERAYGDYERAIEAYEVFVDEWPVSLWRDDAAYRIIQLHDELGHAETTHSLSRAFITDYPESRYQDEVWEILDRFEEGGR